MKKELIVKDKEIKALKILIEKRDNSIEVLKRQFDEKCIEMINLRKEHYKLKKEKEQLLKKNYNLDFKLDLIKKANI